MSQHKEIDVYELVLNRDIFSKGMGVHFNLAKPIRCRNMREMSTLPFINRNFAENGNHIHFKYQEDIEMHTVLLDPGLDRNVMVIALARFIEPVADSKAVDILVKG